MLPLLSHHNSHIAAPVHGLWYPSFLALSNSKGSSYNCGQFTWIVNYLHCSFGFPAGIQGAFWILFGISLNKIRMHTMTIARLQINAWIIETWRSHAVWPGLILSPGGLA